MIISASRRTDIPAYYSEWFFHRLREGYVLTQNPRNPRQIKRISLTPESVDGIVFWTKVSENPALKAVYEKDVNRTPDYELYCYLLWLKNESFDDVVNSLRFIATKCKLSL